LEDVGGILFRKKMVSDEGVHRPPPSPPRPYTRLLTMNLHNPFPPPSGPITLWQASPPLYAAAVWGRSCSRLGRCDDDCLSRAFNRAEGRASGHRGHSPPPGFYGNPKKSPGGGGKAPTSPHPKWGGPTLPSPAPKLNPAPLPHLGGGLPCGGFSPASEPPDPSRHRSP